MHVCFIYQPFDVKWRIYALVNRGFIGSDNGLSPVWRHSLNRCCLIVIHAFGKKFKWNFYHNTTISIQRNIFENVVCKILVILSRPHYVTNCYLTFDLCWRLLRNIYQSSVQDLPPRQAAQWWCNQKSQYNYQRTNRGHLCHQQLNGHCWYADSSTIARCDCPLPC